MVCAKINPLYKQSSRVRVPFKVFIGNWKSDFGFTPHPIAFPKINNAQVWFFDENVACEAMRSSKYVCFNQTPPNKPSNFLSEVFV